MAYILFCLLNGDAEKYHHRLVDEIADKFNITLPKKEALPSHFTLKYWFDTGNINEIEGVIERFCKTHKKTPIKVGGFGKFPPKTIFIKVKLSDEANQTFLELISELKKIQWMPWDKYDAENLYFHSTIAEECNDKFDSILEFLKGKEEYFDLYFDNITILKLVKGTKYVGKWEIHKTFSLK